MPKEDNVEEQYDIDATLLKMALTFLTDSPKKDAVVDGGNADLEQVADLANREGILRALAAKIDSIKKSGEEIDDEEAYKRFFWLKNICTHVFDEEQFHFKSLRADCALVYLEKLRHLLRSSQK